VQNVVKIGQTVAEMAVIHHFGFMGQIFRHYNSQSVFRRHRHAKFCQNWSKKGCRDMAIVRFFKMVLSAMLDLWGIFRDKPQEVIVDVYHWATFG